MPPLVAKRCALSIDTKRKILECIDEKRLPKTEIAKKFGIPKSTLFTIVKNRDSILNAVPERKRIREGKFPLLEKALLDWLKSMRSKNIPLDGNALKEKSIVFFEKLYPNESFKASDGWLQNFKHRHEITFKKICGESSSVNRDTVNLFKEETAKKIMENYSENDIFNADETALFYKLLPDRSLVFKGETCKGVTRSKQRITVLLGANMSGNEKLPLLVIGNSQRPRCFKGVKSLPVTYRANKKAWMTGQLFEEWLRALDKKINQQNRKILLIVDNCSAHPKEIENLKAIKVEYLPPNATSELQPMDQGVIHSFKRIYRKTLIRKILFHVENEIKFDVNLLDALRTVETSWKEVSEKTIKNSFRSAGFHKNDENPCDETIISFDEDLDDDVLREFSEHMKLTDAITNFSDYAKVDDHEQCTAELTEEEIINELLNIDADQDSSSDEDVSYLPKERPSIKQAAEAISTLRNFFEFEQNADEHLEKINNLENALFQSSKLRQTSIADFFTKT